MTRLNRFLGWFFIRAALIFFCTIWTIPVFGLFVSSIRDKDQLAISGWWSALRSIEATGQGRTGVATDQVQENGKYVIRGNAYDGTESGQSNRTILTYGLTATGLADYKVGEESITNDGYTFKLQENGDYEMWSETPFPEDFDRGQRFVFNAQTPPRFTLDNYNTVLNSEGIDDAFINTITVTLPSTIIPISVASFAAYAFSWMRFPGRLFFLMVIVGLLVVPLQLSLIPLLKLYNQFDLRGTYPGIWLAHTAFGLPLAIYLLYNYISAIPREIIESAQIDGASHFQIFTSLIVPLSVPALASFTIFQFLWVWNDLLVAFVFMGTTNNNPVLTMAIRSLSGTRGEDWHIMTASAFLSIIVPIMVFFSLQRYFVRGLMAGSVKG